MATCGFIILGTQENSYILFAYILIISPNVKRNQRSLS